MSKRFLFFYKWSKIGLTEASNFVFKSSSDDDAFSESLFSPNSEDCSITSDSEIDNALPEVQQSDGSDNAVAGTQQSTSKNPP